MEVVMTGATGFIGRLLRRYLASKHRVTALTRRTGLPPEDGVAWVVGDLADPTLTVRLPETVDAIIYLAQGRRYREFPAGAAEVFEANVLGLMSLLEYARERKASRFVFVSSANVYGRTSRPITEDAPLAPATFYARSKRMGELLVESYGECFHCLILRLFTVYGPGQTGTLFPALIDSVKSGRPVEIEGQGGIRLSPIFVHDVAGVTQTLLERDDGLRGTEVFNVAGPEAVDILALSRLIGEIFGVEPKLRFVDGDPAGWVADTTKLQAAVRLRSLTALRDGLLRTIEASR
jgi:UDP-glucose 4-epimerase